MSRVLAIAEALEEGRLRGPLSHWLARAWERLASRSVVRRLEWPTGRRIVAVGGATLGGSGKTPIAMACAVELAAAGARVAFVGHGYGGRLGAARVVGAHDAVSIVGDEALMAARALGPRVPVFVGPRRAQAVALAAVHADVLVLDGVAQTAPIGATLALLVVDGEEPWGRAEAVPPRGDLRAPKESLLSACDAIVPVGAGASNGSPRADRAFWPASTASRGAWMPALAHTLRRTLLTWEDLRRLRVGLVVALARPSRVLRTLAQQGVAVEAVVRFPDHGPLGRGAGRRCRRVARQARIDLWLMTPKCAVHLPPSEGAVECRAPSTHRRPGAWRGRRDHWFGAPVATLEHSIALSPALCARLRALASP